MAEIVLTQGKVALVDEADLELLSNYKWCFNKYVVCHRWNKALKKYEHFYMHRLLLDAPKGVYVDHINGDKLDNRRFNLRLCNQATNIQNSNYSKLPKSGYRGVFYHPDPRYPNRKKPWSSRISVNNKLIYLGYFETPEQASEAYQQAVKEHHPDRYITVK